MAGCPNLRTACPGRALAGRKLASGFFGRCRRTGVRRTPRKSLNSRRVARPAATKTASGVRYYGLRYYSPSTGRWLNRDPIGENGGLGIYVFVANTPIDSFDSQGLDPPANSMGTLEQLFPNQTLNLNAGLPPAKYPHVPSTNPPVPKGLPANTVSVSTGGFILALSNFATGLSDTNYNRLFNEGRAKCPAAQHSSSQVCSCCVVTVYSDFSGTWAGSVASVWQMPCGSVVNIYGDVMHNPRPEIRNPGPTTRDYIPW